MKPLVNELWDTLEALGDYADYYILGTTNHENIRKFLFSTMDEVRLRYARTCTKEILKITDIEDADHFRQGLLRREISRDIAYAKQRDHSAHTLHNYLMGWYLFEKCPLIKRKIDAHFLQRDWPNDDGLYFMNLWPYVSLLHDVGYLFEGAIGPLSNEIQSKQVSIGAEVAHDYFNHRFWIINNSDSIYDRSRIRELANVTELDFSNHSMAAVSDALRSVGDLEQLRKAANRERAANEKPLHEPNHLGARNGLPGDAFDLWQRHYEYYGLPSMAHRIKTVRVVFDSLMREGLGDTGIRILDHGVCGGLLLLLYSTFYFRVYFGLGDEAPTDAGDRQIWQRFRDAGLIHPPEPFQEPSTHALWWWTGVVWATAATCLHNVQQLSGKGPQYASIQKLSLDEDPLAYLGILVDGIQEWDRYSVSREAVISGTLPLQGVDVKLGVTNGIVSIDYCNPDRAQRVTKALNDSLSDEWTQLVSIKG